MTSALLTLADAGGRVSVAAFAGASVAFVVGDLPPAVQLPFSATVLLMAGAAGVVAMVKQQRPSDGDPWRPWTMSVLLALVGALSLAFAASVERRISTLEDVGSAPMRVQVQEVRGIAAANQLRTENQAAMLREILLELRALREQSR